MVIPQGANCGVGVKERPSHQQVVVRGARGLRNDTIGQEQRQQLDTEPRSCNGGTVVSNYVVSSFAVTICSTVASDDLMVREHRIVHKPTPFPPHAQGSRATTTCIQPTKPTIDCQSVARRGNAHHTPGSHREEAPAGVGQYRRTSTSIFASNLQSSIGRRNDPRGQRRDAYSGLFQRLARQALRRSRRPPCLWPVRRQ